MSGRLLGLVVFLGLAAGIVWISSRSVNKAGLSPSRSNSRSIEKSRLPRGEEAGAKREPVDGTLAEQLESAAGGGTEFVVSDRETMPIGEAIIVLCDNWQLIGPTGNDGSLHVRAGLADGTSVLVRAKGYVPETISLVGADPRVVEVRLERAWTLSGVVLDPSGLSVGPGVRVLALEPVSNLTAERLEASFSGAGPSLVATTDQAGEFEFDELDVGLKYRLYAGGNGFCAADPFGMFIGPEASQSPVSLVVYPVYGLHVRLRGPDDSLLELGENIEGAWWGAGVAPLVEDAKIVYSGDWTAVLLGADSAPASGTSPFDRTDYFLTHEDYGEGIDVSFEPQFPGYEPAKFRLRATRVRSSLAMHSIELVPEGSGFGSLTVWFEPIDDVESIVPPESTSGRGMYLLLDELDVAGKQMKIQLPGMESGFCEVSGIPFGRYSVQFRAPHQLFRYPKHRQGARHVTIGDLKASFGVPLTDLGALELNVLKADGSPYMGSVSGTHIRVVGKETDAFLFPSPPYAIPLLPVGDYMLSVWVDGIEVDASFSIMATQVTELEIKAGGV